MWYDCCDTHARVSALTVRHLLRDAGAAAHRCDLRVDCRKAVLTVCVLNVALLAYMAANDPVDTRLTSRQLTQRLRNDLRRQDIGL